jgi:hypothetical protein
MTQLVDQTSPDAPSNTDLAAAIHRVLAASDEPLTVAKLRTQLPGSFRSLGAEELTEVLRRQVAAGALHQYPPYRSQHDRFWDRSMPVHIAALLRNALAEGPLPWSQLRRKLPVYALAQAETVLQDQLSQGRLHRHPRTESRGGERFGVQPPDAKDYLSQELSAVFHKLEQMGFSHTQVRVAALELLHDEEWAPAAPAPRTRPRAEEPTTPSEEPPVLPGRPQQSETLLAGGQAGAPSTPPGGAPPT